MPVAIPNVLSIAGSDPSGGAGIQADLKTFAALRVYGMAAISGLTAQNTCGVRAIQPLPAAFVAAQIDAVFEDIRVDAVKLGMLGDHLRKPASLAPCRPPSPTC
jgi:hydroxymethylpyrimidine/phosphomethylpyrimidine kinase